MKRTMVQSLLAMFFLVAGMFLTTNRADAQTFNWKTEAQALTALDGTIQQLALDIQNFVPGSTQYKDYANHIMCYKLIKDDIQAGYSVQGAEQHTIVTFNDNFTATQEMVTKAVLQQLHQDAILVLTY